MGWRERFTLVCGPGLLAGVTFGDWLHLYRENGFSVSPLRVLNAASSFFGSFGNSFFRRIENWRFGKRIGETSIQPPLFILGHWRNGTTHLHNLFAADRRFAYPNIYQVMYPHTFLTTEAINSRLLASFMPETRFGVDNVQISWAVPYEDEFAIAMADLSVCRPAFVVRTSLSNVRNFGSCVNRSHCTSFPTAIRMNPSAVG